MSCCAWCEEPIVVPAEATGPGGQARAVSHGICRPCLDQQLAALDRRSALPRGAWASRPALPQAAVA